MKQTNVLPAEFNDMLAQVKREHNDRSRFLVWVERLAGQLRWDAICGSWVEKDSGNTLLISLTTEGYSLLLCDNTHCYKKIIRDLTAIAQARRVVICNDAGGPGGDISLGSDGMLRCGALGVFRREEELLRRELADQMDFALSGGENSPFYQ